MDGKPSILETRDPGSTSMSAQFNFHRQLADENLVSQPAQDSMAQLVRQGQDASLRSLQVWADLARKFGSTALSNPTDATMASLAYDPFEKLLEVQRQVADELVATQRHLAQQMVDSTATLGGNVTAR
jgi:hypothetical protein